MSGRTTYYSHNLLATSEPHLFKSAIHDGMDSNKTSVPKLANNIKALAGVGMPLPVKIAGILNRGSGPPSCAHVCIGGLWSSDPNFTISSVAKYLRDCENFNGDMRGDLAFTSDLDHPFLQSLNNKAIFEKTFLSLRKQHAQELLISRETMGEQESFNKLLSTFYIQLDNSGKDNKNWAVMAFLSELVVRGVLKVVIASFLIVGHTHEDVDAFFSKINRALSRKHVGSIPQLLAEVYGAEEKRSLPRSIIEVADYKSHAKPYHQSFKGIRGPMAFKFTMLDNRPIYQYEWTYGGPWLPTFGNSIWKRKDPKSSVDFSVIPPLDREPLDASMFGGHANSEEISTYLKAYIKHIESIQMKTDPTSDLYSGDQAIKDYWKNILKFLDDGWPSNKGNHLKERFWPRTDHAEDDERVSVKSANTDSRNVSGRDDNHPPAHPLSTRTSNLSEDEPDMMSIIMKGGKFGLYALKDMPTIQHLQMRDCGTTLDTAVESVHFIGFGELTKVCQNTPYKVYEVGVTDLVKGYDKRFSKWYVPHIGNTTGEPLHVNQLDIVSTQVGRHFDSKYLSRQYYSLHVIQNFLGVDEVPTMTNTIDLSQGCLIDYAQCYVTLMEEDDVFARLMKMEWTAKPSNTAGGAAEVAPKNKNKEPKELMNTTSLEKECESNHFAKDSHKGQTTLQAFKRRVLAPKNADNLGEDNTPTPADSCGKTTDDGKRRSDRGKGDAVAVVSTNSESRSGQQPTKSTSSVDLHEVEDIYAKLSNEASVIVAMVVEGCNKKDDLPTGLTKYMANVHKRQHKKPFRNHTNLSVGKKIDLVVERAFDLGIEEVRGEGRWKRKRLHFSRANVHRIDHSYN
ncbi:hypothetical protein R1sor_008622 [Riccia sorocarpa]|uniref:DUF7869 domain-containing protein n=1 Tax=Riccia sorocarpa TaxID=122646 RepID=A0ABD3HW16_9MARC